MPYPYGDWYALRDVEDHIHYIDKSGKRVEGRTGQINFGPKKSLIQEPQTWRTPGPHCTYSRGLPGGNGEQLTRWKKDIQRYTSTNQKFAQVPHDTTVWTDTFTGRTGQCCLVCGESAPNDATMRSHMLVHRDQQRQWTHPDEPNINPQSQWALNRYRR